jgi:hypothetical protein
MHLIHDRLHQFRLILHGRNQPGQRPIRHPLLISDLDGITAGVIRPSTSEIHTLCFADGFAPFVHMEFAGGEVGPLQQVVDHPLQAQRTAVVGRVDAGDAVGV